MNDFITYLQQKKLSIATINRYERLTKQFITWFGNDAMNYHKKDVLNYLSYLKNNTNQQNISRNNSLIALRHYFDFLVREELINKNPTAFIKIRGTNKRRLHYIFNLEELQELADAYYQLEVKRTQEKLQKPKTGAGEYLLKRSYWSKMRNYTILTFFIHQGLHVREVLALTTQDIELHKANVNIKAGTVRGNQRNIPLHATQIGVLLQYINEIRPQLKTTETDDTLFLPIPKKDPKAKKQNAQPNFKRFTKKLKDLNPNFTSLEQLRASLITYWIQTYGLRKAQYLAGHKSIVSTEEYIPNNIEDLAEDLTKFNPF